MMRPAKAQVLPAATLLCAPEQSLWTGTFMNWEATTKREQTSVLEDLLKLESCTRDRNVTLVSFRPHRARLQYHRREIGRVGQVSKHVKR